MLTPWLDLPGAAARARWLGEIAGLDLLRLGMTAPAEEIRDTAVTQPLIVALGLIAASELPLDDVEVTAGHSVGELTAAALAGVLSPEAATAFAAVRGREMAAACARTPTGMSVVLGGDEATVLARLADCGLVGANRNGAGQIVAAGPLDGLEALAADPPAGARIRALPVAGAFHTEFMAPAEAALAAIADGVTVAEPAMLMLSNADGLATASGRDTMKRLVRQVTAPVRWDLCQSTLADLGVSTIIELPPAGALAGLARRSLPGVDVLALRSPADLPAARELLARAGASGQATHTPEWRMVVSPARGTWHPKELAEQAHLIAGAALGAVHTRRDDQPVSTAYDGVLVEWLVQDGDLVDAGDPLARMHPLPVPVGDRA